MCVVCVCCVCVYMCVCVCEVSLQSLADATPVQIGATMEGVKITSLPDQVCEGSGDL